jgi:hypothetical protein
LSPTLPKRLGYPAKKGYLFSVNRNDERGKSSHLQKGTLLDQGFCQTAEIHQRKISNEGKNLAYFLTVIQTTRAQVDFEELNALSIREAANRYIADTLDKQQAALATTCPIFCWKVDHYKHSLQSA